MTPEGEPGVSDFGISSGELPGRRAAGRAADRAADSDSDSAGAGSDDPRFALATEVRRIISAMVGLPLEDDELPLDEPDELPLLPDDVGPEQAPV